MYRGVNDIGTLALGEISTREIRDGYKRSDPRILPGA